MHDLCYITNSSSKHLEKSRKQKEKESDIVLSSNQILSSEICEDEPESFLSPKHLRSSVGGPLHDKTKCIWRLKGEDLRHPNRPKSKLFRINTNSAWQTFKCHAVLIEDRELRDRLTRLVESTSVLSDVFVMDIMYHHPCWLKYITNVKIKSEDAMHFQSVSLSEARSLFFRHVDTVIFKEHEIRSLQSLLDDYKCIVTDYGYPVGAIKSSYVKELLINEYKDDIGFKGRRIRVSGFMMFLGEEITLRQLCHLLASVISSSSITWPGEYQIR